jgi:hypothetical protein
MNVFNAANISTITADGAVRGQLRAGDRHVPPRTFELSASYTF